MLSLIPVMLKIIIIIIINNLNRLLGTNSGLITIMRINPFGPIMHNPKKTLVFVD